MKNMYFFVGSIMTYFNIIKYLNRVGASEVKF